MPRLTASILIKGVHIAVVWSGESVTSLYSLVTSLVLGKVKIVS